MDLPTVRQLECLVAVADSLNLRRAAGTRHITRPALGEQIHQLADALEAGL